MTSPTPAALAALQAEVDRLTAERKLLLRSLELHERDRQLLAFEIHDGVVQDMSAAHMFLSAAASGLAFSSPAAEENFSRAAALLQNSVAEARRLIRGLIPVVLDDAGLETSLAKLIDRFAADYSLPVARSLESPLPDFAPAIQLIILRMVQETLTNVWRHSQSPRAEVTVGRQGEMLAIVIRDWGVGFDPQAVQPTRYGLTGIRERARLLQGSAEIVSRPGAGTIVTLHIPLCVETT